MGRAPCALVSLPSRIFSSILLFSNGCSDFASTWRLTAFPAPKWKGEHRRRRHQLWLEDWKCALVGCLCVWHSWVIKHLLCGNLYIFYRLSVIMHKAWLIARKQALREHSHLPEAQHPPAPGAPGPWFYSIGRVTSGLAWRPKTSKQGLLL